MKLNCIKMLDSGSNMYDQSDILDTSTTFFEVLPRCRRLQSNSQSLGMYVNNGLQILMIILTPMLDIITAFVLSLLQSVDQLVDTGDLHQHNDKIKLLSHR